VRADAVAALAAVAVVMWVVLRDIVAYDRPARPPATEPPAPPAPPAPVVAPPPPVVAPLPPPVVEVDETSILSGLTSVEHDERSPLRRVGAAVMLLTLTLVTAGLVGAGIYRAITGLN
jgi:hypothetical protein